MKNAKIIFKLLIVLSIITISCEKETIPILDFNGFIKSQDCYIATDMKVRNYYYYEINPDTVDVSGFHINLGIKGKMVSKSVEFENPNPHVSGGLKLEYFINIIKEFSITSNKIFIDKFDVTQCFTNTDYLNTVVKLEQAIGYSPIVLQLNQPPLIADYYTFTIRIVDKFDNVFETTTDSVFIKNK